MSFVQWLFQAFFLPFHCFIPYFSPAIRDTHILVLIIHEFVPLVLPFLGLWVTGSHVLDPRVPVLRFLDPWVPCSLGPTFVFNPPKWGGSITTSKISYNAQQEYNFHHFVPMWTLVMLLSQGLRWGRREAFLQRHWLCHYVIGWILHANLFNHKFIYTSGLIR